MGNRFIHRQCSLVLVRDTACFTRPAAVILKDFRGKQLQNAFSKPVKKWRGGKKQLSGCIFS
jgi:hypothetical protein